MTMATRKNRDLSHIDSLEDLRAEIIKVRASVKQKEKGLEERMSRLPQETIKATVGAVIPFFLNNTVAAKTWNIAKAAAGLIFTKPSSDKKGVKENLISSAKQLGLFTILRTAYDLWRGRK